MGNSFGLTPNRRPRFRRPLGWPYSPQATISGFGLGNPPHINLGRHGLRKPFVRRGSSFGCRAARFIRICGEGRR